MSTAKQGTTLILASVAVCLLIYVMKQKMAEPENAAQESGVEAVVGAVRRALGMSGGRPRADCSKISPSHADWARCAQGSAMGRVPTKHPSAVLSNTSLDFASDSLQNQGLGTGRLQDDFVHDQFSSDNNLGVSRPGGMRISKMTQEHRGGQQKATDKIMSGISSSAAAAFPFARKSTPRPDGEETRLKKAILSELPGDERAAGGMSLKNLLAESQRTKGRGRGIGGFAARSQVSRKLGVAPFEESGAEFNPFAGAEGASSGLKLSEAYDAPALGMGSTLADAYGGGGGGGGGGAAESLGAAVSPFSSSASVGVSPVEISAATAALPDVNIVQSTGGGHIDRFIRP